MIDTSKWEYRVGVKTLPPPIVPGKTESERMDNAVQKMFSTPRQRCSAEMRNGRRLMANDPNLRSRKPFPLGIIVGIVLLIIAWLYCDRHPDSFGGHILRLIIAP